jgi:hypothetical protein
MVSYEYRAPLSLEVFENHADQRISVGNTGFWVTLKDVAYSETPVWVLNFTPENNGDGNILEERKTLYKNLFLVALDAFWSRQIEQNGEDEYPILTAPHTNYRFFRFLQKLVLEHAPESELNHTILQNNQMRVSGMSLEERYLKHRYSIHLPTLFASKSFQMLLDAAHQDINEKISQGFNLVFELED